MTLPEDEVARRAAAREQARADAAARAEAVAAERHGAARERRWDDAVGERGHTPEGWVPANRRTDFRDPLSRRSGGDAAARLARQLGGAPDAERGRTAPPPKKKRKRIRRPGN